VTASTDATTRTIPTQNTHAAPRPHDPLHALQGFLVLDVIVRLLMWSTAFALATAILIAMPIGFPSLPHELSWRIVTGWGLAAALWIVLFNAVYVIELVVLRLFVPTPREGRYATNTRRPDRQVLWACLIALLTKARLDAPFPGFLVFHVANLPPLRWLMNPIFGPRSRSCYVVDPRVLDPHLVTIGRNVVIGLDAVISGHYEERDTVVFKRTTIEDDALIGGYAVIFGGVHIKAGAVVGAGAVVLPNTVIGPNEFWGGVPARKIRDLNLPGAAEA